MCKHSLPDIILDYIIYCHNAKIIKLTSYRHSLRYRKCGVQGFIHKLFDTNNEWLLVLVCKHSLPDIMLVDIIYYDKIIKLTSYTV